MSMIRPEVAAGLYRWREAIAAAVLCALGIWVFSLGGWLMQGLGGLIAVFALSLLVMGIQRGRFAPQGQGPGIVEIDEGQIAWYGPGIGGFISLAELSDLGLITVQGLRVWRFRQRDGQLLLVPIDAQGADQLYDALASLPGLEVRRLLAAVEASSDVPFLWRRERENILHLRRP